ncbi:MAG TPA: DNA polymerase III subunit [Mariprofundaceae bacterium]|nr:DNA polymerase III subunit [Mariprofundaceae bacterium]
MLGHADVERRFLNSLRDRSLHHAWLLHGPSGIGKAMLAGRLAAAYLCERSRAEAGATACGECHACHMLQAGSHPDYLQVGRIEGKRDINVEQVRSLLSFLALSGAESERRVVLLDDASSMNLQASNALLKGLEEPAAGSLLLIVCDDLVRLPATVRSRCMLERMATLSDDDCRAVLKGLGLEGRVLDLALMLADGRPGRMACLTDEEVAGALLDWRDLTRDLGRADIGALQDWLMRHVQRVPHALLADTVLRGLEPALQQQGGFDARDGLMQHAWELAAWPQRVVRQSLRAAPTLLSHLLSLRVALRALEGS